MEHIRILSAGIEALVQAIVDYFVRVWEEVKEYFTDAKDKLREIFDAMQLHKDVPLPAIQSSWDWDLLQHKHQQHIQIKMKVQDAKYLTWEQPWKAWKGQRR